MAMLDVRSLQGCNIHLTEHHSKSASSARVPSLESDGRTAILGIQTEVLSVMTNELVKKGFEWVLPVMLAKSTDPLWPDPGASIEKRIQLEIYGENVRPMQSMILHKRVLASLGPERFFILSPNIRIERRERAKTGWHLYEFTQLDLEIAQGKMEDIFELIENLIKTLMTVVREKLKTELRTLNRELGDPKVPFEVIKRGELEVLYGKHWEQDVSRKSTDPIWVTDLPREFYDYEDERTGEWRNFDLILPQGYGEVVSGAEREYEYDRIVQKLEKDGLKKEHYEALLKLAKDGRLKPSAGAGLGVERLLAYLCGVNHVADVQPFPRVPGIVPEL